MYDEFGNYIGPELESEGESEAGEDADDVGQDVEDEEMAMVEDDDAEPEMAVVLHEDKKYYPTAEEVNKSFAEAFHSLVIVLTSSVKIDGFRLIYVALFGGIPEYPTVLKE